jgi:hypothetical protein
MQHLLVAAVVVARVQVHLVLKIKTVTVVK